MAETTFTELTGIDMEDAPVVRPADTLHGEGADTRRAASEAEIKLDEETGVRQTLESAWAGNMGPMVWDALQRKYAHPPEADFDKEAWVDANKDDLVGINLEAFDSVRSVGEAEELRYDQYKAQDTGKQLAAKGYGGLAAQLLVGVADIDLPVMVATAGFAAAGKSATRAALGVAGRFTKATSTPAQLRRAHAAVKKARATQQASPRAMAMLQTAEGTAAATSQGLAFGAVAAEADPLGDDTQIVIGGLFGAGLGTLGAGYVAARRYNKVMNQAREDYAPSAADLPDAQDVPSEAPVYFKPVAQTQAEAAAEVIEAAAATVATGTPKRGPVAVKLDPAMQPLAGPSVGAGARTATMDMSEMNPSHRAILADAMADNNKNRVGEKLDSPEIFADTAAGRTAARLSRALAEHPLTMPLRTDFDELALGGAIEQNIAFNLMESAEGRAGRTKTAALLQRNFENRLASESMPTMEHAYAGWVKRHNVGFFDRHRRASRQAFDRELINELEGRYHDGKSNSLDPDIVKAADAIDANTKLAADEIGPGRKGELPVTGFEGIKSKAGFFSHRWSGKAIRKLYADGKSKEQVLAALEVGIEQTNQNMTPAHRKIVAQAIIRRALAKHDGVDSNMLSTMDADGQDYLRDLLKDSGMDADDLEGLMVAIRGADTEKGKLGTTKQRIQVDLRTEVDGVSLTELVDDNVVRVLSQYNRSVSGAAALARKGIQNKTQQKALIDAAMAERRARGMEAGRAQQKFLEDIFTHFNAGPIGGGINPYISRAKRITNLVLLNQMGLTQLGETGAQISAVGLSTWWRHAKPVMKNLRGKGPNSPIANELKPFMGRLGEEHMLVRDDLMLDEMSATGATDAGKFLDTLDYALGKGQRLQGYASGFFAVKGLQQQIAITSMADKVMQRLRDGTDASALADIGISQKLKKYIDDGTVEFARDQRHHKEGSFDAEWEKIEDANLIKKHGAQGAAPIIARRNAERRVNADKGGWLDRLNLEKWDPADAEDFVIALDRHTQQVVQKSLAGEDSMWMHKDVGSMMIHLKSFPLTAMRKQAVRNAAIGNQALYSQLLMGLATAGMAWEIKQIINGRTEYATDPMSVMKGAIGMSNMTGWFPMLTDPAASALGMDYLTFNDFGRFSIDQGLLAIPPAIPTLNRLGHIPGALNPLGDMSRKQRFRAMKATPIVGNLYGVAGILNAMETD